GGTRREVLESLHVLTHRKVGGNIACAERIHGLKTRYVQGMLGSRSTVRAELFESYSLAMYRNIHPKHVWNRCFSWNSVRVGDGVLLRMRRRCPVWVFKQMSRTPPLCSDVRYGRTTGTPTGTTGAPCDATVSSTVRGEADGAGSAVIPRQRPTPLHPPHALR